MYTSSHLRTRARVPASLFLTLAAALTRPSATHAVPQISITWGTAQNISGNSDVVTTGTLVYAYNFGAASVSSTTVNGVTFAPFAISGTGTTTVGSTSLTISSSDFASNSNFGSGSAPYSGLSSAYQTLLSAGTGDTNGSSISLSISGLTSGQAYTFEWWTNDAAPFFGENLTTTATATNAVTLSSNPSDTAGTPGQYVIGTFTEISTGIANMSFTNSSQSTPLISGFELRTVPAPEPGSATLLSLGAGALLGWRQRRG